MTALTALIGARIFDGDIWHEDAALLVEDARIHGICGLADIPPGAERIDASGKLITPGFIDLQVNGGGGVLLNEQPDAEGIRTICAAHARYGTTALLATLITDTPEITARAIAAGRQARADHIPGFLGLHLEGPHLSLARKGTHDPALIRPMEEADLAAMIEGHKHIGVTMVTLAPENTTEDQVAALSQAGIVVSLGHSDTDYATAARYVEAGATTVTHLFNAMSPLGHRQPGMVGATLDIGKLHAGLIADGFHVDPASIGVALRAKKGPGRIFLVTDAMSTVGSTQTSLFLNGREIFRKDGRLTLADGTLAGADIDMLSSMRFVHEKLGLDLGEALRMASAYAAEAMGVSSHKGHLGAGADADFLLLTPDLDLAETWIAGKRVFEAA